MQEIDVISKHESTTQETSIFLGRIAVWHKFSMISVINLYYLAYKCQKTTKTCCFHWWIAFDCQNVFPNDTRCRFTCLSWYTRSVFLHSFKSCVRSFDEHFGTFDNWISPVASIEAMNIWFSTAELKFPGCSIPSAWIVEAWPVFGLVKTPAVREGPEWGREWWGPFH